VTRKAHGAVAGSRRAVDLPRAARAIEEFLVAIGAPVDTDPELRGTGARVAEAYAKDLLSGYDLDPAALFAEATSSSASGLVVVASIATTTLCPHHLLPASGLTHVGYWPADRVVGLGAIARVVDCFSRRLALQEDIGQNVVDALVTHLGARGAGAIVDLAPLCMTARGERRHGAHAVTMAFAGAVDASMRAELASAVALSRRAGDE
jgi:GTP cyclohydrolase I